jgi:pimeloyl-ACP methyl ester carboxylesterase
MVTCCSLVARHRDLWQPPPLAQGVRAVRAIRRRPWEGELPVEQVAAASFPTLVISGDHSPAFEAVCDALAARLPAQRAHLPGAGHATPETGDAFNETLEAFIGAAPRRDPPRRDD